MPPRQQFVQCDSLRTLECELDSIRDKLAIPESEDTWDTLAKSVTRFTTLIQNGAANFPNEVATGLRSIARPLNSAILSERSRLSGAGIDLLKAAAEWIGKAFDGLIPLYLPTLLTLCSRSNKVFISRAKACVINIIEATQAPIILSYLAEASKDKSLSLRLSAAEGCLACLNSFNPPDLEKEVRGRDVETLIKSTATDPSADIRKVGKRIFEAYKILLPHRVDTFTGPLTPTMKKYLDIRSRAPSAASQAGPSSRPPSSQSTHSTDAALATRPKSAMSKSSTTLFPTASGSNPGGGFLRTRTVSTIASSGPGLTRSESAPSTSQPTSTTTTAPQRPAIGPARSRPGPPMAQKGPSRPVSYRDMPPPATIPIRPQPAVAPRPASSSPEPNPFAPDPKPNALKTSGGPLRPHSGPSRVPQDTGESKQRVVGGARRVLLPVEPVPSSPTPAPAPEVKKASVVSGHSRTPSNASADQVLASKPAKPEALPKTQAPPAAPRVEVKKEKVEPPKLKARSHAPPSKPAPTTSRRGHDPSVSTSTNATTYHTNATTTSRRAGAGTTSSRLTEPTQSQLAKTKAPTRSLATKKTEVAKPISIRPVPHTGKASAPAKGAAVPVRKRVVSTAPKAGARLAAPSPEVVAVAGVPLRSSPAPSASPLPPSPAASDVVTVPSPTPAPAPAPSLSQPPTDAATQDGDDKSDGDEDEEEPTIIQYDQPHQALPEIREPSRSPSSPPSVLIQLDPATPDANPSTPRPTFPHFQTVPETPISSLLESIQRGFDFTPAPPFDPDQTCTYGGLVSGEDVKCEPLLLERRPLHPIT